LYDNINRFLERGYGSVHLYHQLPTPTWKRCYDQEIDITVTISLPGCTGTEKDYFLGRKKAHQMVADFLYIFSFDQVYIFPVTMSYCCVYGLPPLLS
jgi:hypothetical protein